MLHINSLFLTANMDQWLANSRYPRVLHVFDRACNLINERGEVLSVVTQQIGNGPFNLVIEDDVLFPDYLSLESPVSFSTTQLHLGDLTIDTADAKLWSPRPDWEELHSKREIVLHQIREIVSSPTALLAMMGAQLPITNYQFSNSPVSSLSSALVTIDIPMAKHLASQLAGLGIGLTPAGDDFIMGALYAAWILHPPDDARNLAKEIAETAAPLTTSLSGTWLRSAGMGEAGALWHDLFNSLIIPFSNIQLPITKLLSVGETSGADALAGFIGTLISYAEVDTKICPS